MTLETCDHIAMSRRDLTIKKTMTKTYIVFEYFLFQNQNNKNIMTNTKKNVKKISKTLRENPQRVILATFKTNFISDD